MNPRAPLAALLLAALLLSLVPAVRAQDPGPRLSFAVRDEPLGAAIDRLARAAGQLAIVDPRVAEVRVSADIRDLPWREAVALLAARAGAAVEEHPGGLLGVVPIPANAIRCARAPLTLVLLVLAEQAGRNAVIGPGVTGEVTLELERTSWLDALREVARRHGLRLEEREGGIVTCTLLDPPADPEALALRERVEELERALEARRAPPGAPPTVSAIVLDGEGGARAILDGRVYREGDVLVGPDDEELEGLRVGAIRHDGVELRDARSGRSAILPLR